MNQLELPLCGPGGEPVDIRRTFLSHGLASLPPMAVDDAGDWFQVTLRLTSSAPRTVRVDAAKPGTASVTVSGRPVTEPEAEEILEQLRHVLRLDEDLSAFYRLAARDKRLSWVTAGAGRMIRSQTVFEDVVKTICTTNCSWSATRRMVDALVTNLGEPTLDAEADGAVNRVFPTPKSMAEADEDFYKQVVRAGYRGAYLRKLACMVVDEEVNLGRYSRVGPDDLPDDDLANELLELPGVGPYAASHIMMMLGRYSRPILDSWTRPTYARLVRRKQVEDAVIEKRFRRYKQYAGLAFWLFVTRDWIAETDVEALD